jgi:hypothetical protein
MRAHQERSPGAAAIAASVSLHVSCASRLQTVTALPALRLVRVVAAVGLRICVQTLRTCMRAVGPLGVVGSRLSLLGDTSGLVGAARCG